MFATACKAGRDGFPRSLRLPAGHGNQEKTQQAAPHHADGLLFLHAHILKQLPNPSPSQTKNVTAPVETLCATAKNNNPLKSLPQRGKEKDKTSTRGRREHWLPC